MTTAVQHISSASSSPERSHWRSSLPDQVDHLHEHQDSDQDKSSQPFYVLSADGSRLFLLDPSKPSGNEEPPPYAPFTTEVTVPDVDHEPGPSSPNRNVPFPAFGPNTLVLPQDGHRHRASTMSAVGRPRIDGHSPTRRPRYTSSHSHSHYPTSSLYPGPHPTHTAASSPGTRHAATRDETTPLLADSNDWVEVSMPKRRGVWRSVFCGEVEEGDQLQTWGDGWRRFWKPVGQKHYWKAMSHLWLLNLPFALSVWPFLVAGTVAGTALLITLPIGAAVWWLTLILTRSAARLETIMQLQYHSPLSSSTAQPSYHPIFHRIKERSAPFSPISNAGEPPADTEVVWETTFSKCSWDMFSDHYSYCALSYFLLIKPLNVLFSTIFLWALLPPALVLIFTLPVYLRVARRWGKWQAGVALNNL